MNFGVKTDLNFTKIEIDEMENVMERMIEVCCGSYEDCVAARLSRVAP